MVVGALLRDLAHEAGATVVCATHDPLLIDLADDELRLGRTVTLAAGSSGVGMPSGEPST